jgi:hypothetical protein
MLRRAFLSFVPAFLALAFLCGTPGSSIGGPEAGATSWSTGTATTPVARGSLTQDIPDGAVNQSADEDDTPDARIVRVVTAVIWPASALSARILHASDRAGPSHRPCAAPPRAPPTA